MLLDYYIGKDGDLWALFIINRSKKRVFKKDSKQSEIKAWFETIDKEAWNARHTPNGRANVVLKYYRQATPVQI